MSTIGTMTRPDATFAAALGTRFALALLAEATEARDAKAAPAAPQPQGPAIPLQTGVECSTLFAVRFAAALRAATRRKNTDPHSRKEGSSW
jgi:hypothetical protein